MTGVGSSGRPVSGATATAITSLIDNNNGYGASIRSGAGNSGKGLLGVTQNSMRNRTNGQSACFVDPKRIAQSAVGSDLLSVLAKLKAIGGGIWNLAEHRGARPEEFEDWEQTRGVKLPEDFKDFMSATDGIAARWVAPLNGQLVDIGSLAINCLGKMTQIYPTQAGKTSMPKGTDHTGKKRGDDKMNLSSALPKGTVAVFAITESKGFGVTALVYQAGTATTFTTVFDAADGERRLIPEHPQVWFRDLSENWHFVSDCFADYMRLAFVHFGVKGWQYVFTEHGPDPETEQWLRLLCPGRLEIDEDRALFPQRVFASGIIDQDGIDKDEDLPSTGILPETEPSKLALVRLAYLDTIEPRPASSRSAASKLTNNGKEIRSEKDTSKIRKSFVGKTKKSLTSSSRSNSSRRQKQAS